MGPFFVDITGQCLTVNALNRLFAGGVDVQNHEVNRPFNAVTNSSIKSRVRV